jgi:hypothetical protein
MGSADSTVILNSIIQREITFDLIYGCTALFKKQYRMIALDRSAGKFGLLSGHG